MQEPQIGDQRDRQRRRSPIKMPVGQEGVNAPNKIMRAQGTDGSAINGSSRAQGTSKSANGELGCEDTSLWDTRVQRSMDHEGRMSPIEMPM